MEQEYNIAQAVYGRNTTLVKDVESGQAVRNQLKQQLKLELA
jgi:hypothetical protein